MLMLKSLNGCAFATIAIRDARGEVIATAFDLLTAGKIASLLSPYDPVEFIPVFSDTWHYDEGHKVTTL